MIGATSGRMSTTVPNLERIPTAPNLERTRWYPREDTVFILDQKMSILLLNHDPGEGVEVLVPAYTNKEIQ